MKDIAKNKTLVLVTLLILIVYNVVAFVLPFNRGGGFWTGYGFAMLALLMTAGVSYYAFDRGGLQSKFYSIPLISVAWGYLALQLALGLAQMALGSVIPCQYMIVLNVILLCICLIGLITVNSAKEEIQRIDAKVREKVFYIKSLQVDVEGMAGRVSDDPVERCLKDLAETIRYSDPMSSPQLAAIENKIEAKTAALADAVERADNDAAKALCNELQQLLAERNRKCKILK
ncbi:MAG: hypothetical protein FWG50_13805 [Kiritimatiellaeota bacterium]|nr:hypothetical protein [Kiritimatiellota bacterium]